MSFPFSFTRARESSGQTPTEKKKHKGDIWVKYTAKVAYSASRSGDQRGARYFGILSLGSACGTCGEKRLHWGVLWRDLKNMPKRERERERFRWAGERWGEMQVLPGRTILSEWCSCFCFCYKSSLDVYFDFILNVFVSFTKKFYIIYPPHWGTGTVTLAFSFLEDVIDLISS